MTTESEQIDNELGRENMQQHGVPPSSKWPGVRVRLVIALIESQLRIAFFTESRNGHRYRFKYGSSASCREVSIYLLPDKKGMNAISESDTTNALLIWFGSVPPGNTSSYEDKRKQGELHPGKPWNLEIDSIFSELEGLLLTHRKKMAQPEPAVVGDKKVEDLEAKQKVEEFEKQFKSPAAAGSNKENPAADRKPDPKK
jgi:hypothetical protein